MSSTFTLYVRCVGRRVAKAPAPFAGQRAVHILLGHADDPMSYILTDQELVETVHDLCRTKDGLLRDVVVLGPQQTAGLVSSHLLTHSSFITRVQVSHCLP